MLLYKNTIHMSPFAQERPRVRVITRGNKPPIATVYDPKRSKQFKKNLKEFFANDMFDKNIIDQPVILTCIFYVKRPKSVSRHYPSVKPDLSNYIKGIEDAMNGIVYKDDSLIIGYNNCWKLYTTSEPRIIIELNSVANQSIRMKDEYTIRRDVLNIPLEMWKKLMETYGDNFITISISPLDCIKQFGLLNGLSTKYNEGEKQFFKEMNNYITDNKMPYPKNTAGEYL